MEEKDFIERELSGTNGFGELPEDLRSSGSVSLPDGTIINTGTSDAYTMFGTRTSVEPIPSGMANQINWAAINYLPRANFESFRSQRFFAGGTALLPPDPTTFVDLLIDAPLPAAVTFSSGVLLVPQGYAAVVTGLRQWIGDASAYQKPDGQPDDIVWRITIGATSMFKFGNFPFVISSNENEAKLFAIANESTTIQASVKNNISPSSYFARSIPVTVGITGHWFPIDELDDIFRNR